MSAPSIEYLPCKDCGKLFARSSSVKDRERLAGESEPERCPEHRRTHAREYRLFAVSHVEVSVDPEALASPHDGRWFNLGRPPRDPVRIDFETVAPPKFPVDEIWPDLEAALLRRTHRAVVLVGPTGSGKSTLIPLRLMQSEDLARQGTIVVTQPRIPAAERIPSFVLHLHSGTPVATADLGMAGPPGSPLPPDLRPWIEMTPRPEPAGMRFSVRLRGPLPDDVGRRIGDVFPGLFAGEGDQARAKEVIDRLREAVRVAPGAGLDVGYTHSQARDRRDRFNRLVFMTDGTLINEITDGRIGNYSLVMIDEAHERSLNIDLILGLLKARLPRYPRLRAMIASATVDAPRFVRYFGGTVPGDLPQEYPRRVDCGAVLLLESRGQTREIAEVWSDESIAFLGPLGAAASLFEERNDPPGPRWPLHEREVRSDLWYQPTFRSLIFRGIMDDARRRTLSTLRGDPAWGACIEALYELSRRPRPCGEGKTTGRDNPILPKMCLMDAGSLEWVEADLRPTAVRDRTPLLWAMVDKILELIERDEERLRLGIGVGGPRHILAFLDATIPIDEGRRLLTEQLAARGGAGRNRVFRFYARLRETPEGERELQAACEPPADPGERKIILATNMAETSLTLPGLGYVVDTGLINETYWNPEREEDEHLIILHSRAGCRQRRGRVGRDEPGEVHYLYSRKEFEDGRLRRDYTVPHVQRANLEEAVLKLKRAVVALERFEWIDPPPRRELQRSVRRLTQLGALDHEADLTGSGDEILRLQFDRPVFGKLVLEADRHCCAVEMATFLGFVRKGGADSLRRPYLWEPGLARPAEDRTPEEREGEEQAEEAGPREPAETGKAADPSQVPLPLVELCRQARIGRCQEAVRIGALDDLEAYLRIFWIWESKGAGEAADAWARSQGVNPQALRDVLGDRNRLLGGLVDPDKGGASAIRPVDLALLDRVRAIIASVVDDWLYAAAPDGLVYPVSGIGGAHTDPVRLDVNSVCYGRPAPGLFAALARRRVASRQLWWEAQAPRGRVLLVSHIVALNAEWCARETRAAIGKSIVARALAGAAADQPGRDRGVALAEAVAGLPLYVPEPLGSPNEGRTAWTMATGYCAEGEATLTAVARTCGETEAGRPADVDVFWARDVVRALAPQKGRVVDAEVVQIVPDRHRKVPIAIVRPAGTSMEVPVVAGSPQARLLVAGGRPGGRVSLGVPRTAEDLAKLTLAPAVAAAPAGPADEGPVNPEEPFRRFMQAHPRGTRVVATIEGFLPSGVRVRVRAGDGQAITAFIPLDELQWEQVSSLTPQVLQRLGLQTGTALEAVVWRFREDRRTIELSRKRLTAHPGLGRYRAGQGVTGAVDRLDAKGIWVGLEPGLSGFLPSERLPSWMRGRVRPGADLRVRIEGVDAAAARVDLAVAPGPLRPGDALTNVRVVWVSDEKKTVLVDLGDTRAGAIFASDWDRRFIAKLSEVVKVGDRLERVVVLQVSGEGEQQRIRLSRKQALAR